MEQVSGSWKISSRSISQPISKANRAPSDHQAPHGRDPDVVFLAKDPDSNPLFISSRVVKPLRPAYQQKLKALENQHQADAAAIAKL